MFTQFGQNMGLVTAKEFLAAAASGKNEVVDEYIRQNGGYILQNNKRMNVTDEHGNTALILAVKNQQVDTVKLLLKSNIDVNAFENFGYNTALHWAVENGNDTMLYTLLADDRIDLGCLNRRGESPLTLAVRFENVHMVKLLLEAGAPIVRFDEYISYLDARINLDKTYGQKDVYAKYMTLQIRMYKEMKDLLNLHHTRSVFCNALANLHVTLSKSEIRKIHSMSTEDFAALPCVIHDSVCQAFQKFDVEAVTTNLNNKTDEEPRNNMRM